MGWFFYLLKQVVSLHCKLEFNDVEFVLIRKILTFKSYQNPIAILNRMMANSLNPFFILLSQNI